MHLLKFIMYTLSTTPHELSNDLDVEIVLSKTHPQEVFFISSLNHQDVFFYVA